MKNQWFMTLPLAAALVLPAVAQQTPADSQQPSATSSQSQFTVVVQPGYERGPGDAVVQFRSEPEFRSEPLGAPATGA